MSATPGREVARDERTPKRRIGNSHRRTTGDVGFISPAPIRKNRRSLPVLSGLLIAVCLLWGSTAALVALATEHWAFILGAPTSVIGFGLAAFVLMRHRLVAVTVVGSSMEPAYLAGDRVLVRRNPALSVGQVVMVERPFVDATWHGAPMRKTAEIASRQWLIKRVAALPGDPIPRETVAALAEAPEEHVPPGKLILLGDNRNVSFDSAIAGYFPIDRVLGVVVRLLSRQRVPTARSYPASGVNRGPKP